MYILILLFLVSLCACGGGQGEGNGEGGDSIVAVVPMKYGVPIEEFVVTYDTIRQGETLAEVLIDFGMTPSQVYELTQCPDSVFDVRKLRPGQACAYLCNKDSAATPRYFVYEESRKAYVRFDLLNNYQATRAEKPTEWREGEVAGEVNSSLWVAMQEAEASPMLAVMLSHIFGWSIDFFGIQKGDEFRLVYAQEYVEEEPLNNYKVLAASFKANDSLVYAIPFVQDDEELFYNVNGNSLEGAFLKAPLDFYRISSRFTNSRYHPVLKRNRAHHGVDYAAPTGTPVYAIGSGKVIDKGYQAGGGGNYVKIRHNSTYTTTYMHLSKFAKGLKVGLLTGKEPHTANPTAEGGDWLCRLDRPFYRAALGLPRVREWQACESAHHKIATQEAHQRGKSRLVCCGGRLAGEASNQYLKKIKSICIFYKKCLYLPL